MGARLKGGTRASRKEVEVGLGLLHLVDKLVELRERHLDVDVLLRAVALVQHKLELHERRTHLVALRVGRRHCVFPTARKERRYSE